MVVVVAVDVSGVVEVSGGGVVYVLSAHGAGCCSRYQPTGSPGPAWEPTA